MSKRTRLLGILALMGAASGAANADVGDVYVVDLRSTGEVFYMPTDASTQTTIGFALYTTFAMDFNPDATELWALVNDANNFPQDFGTIDLDNGEFTPIVPASGDIPGDAIPTGMTFAPDGTAYVSTADSLYTVDLDTGVTTLVGSFGAGGIMIDIAVDVNGDMYAHSISDDALYSVDRDTGAATLIGFTGLAANFAQGMDFDWSDNTLYATIYTGGGTGQYVEWDTDTGQVTQILDTTPWNYEMEMSVRSPADDTGCPADLDGSGTVDISDFFLFLDLFSNGDMRADMNDDGVVDISDFFLYLDFFSQGC